MPLGTFDPNELEFLAEDLVVTIVPKTKHRTISLLCADFGPFEPAIPIDVPLWVAVHMRKRRDCHLVPPEWLNVEALLKYKEMEHSSPVHTEMPPCYVEISHILLEHFEDSIPKSLEVRGLIKDILDIRLARVRTSLAAHMKGPNVYAEMYNLTEMELSSVRNLLTKGMDQLDMLRTASVARIPAAERSVLRTTLNTTGLLGGTVRDFSLDDGDTRGNV